MSFSTNGQTTHWDLRALSLEREIYAAKDAATHNRAVAAKADVRKQQGLYKEALAELGRIYTYALGGEELADYYYQRALCGYLAGDFDSSLAAIDEAAYYVAQEQMGDNMALVEALAAGEKGEWERSAKAAARYLAIHPLTPEIEREIEELYRTTPRLRNPDVAWWLSILPGVGQLYAGEPWSALVSLSANVALGTFAVSEMIAGQWLSGWIVGCGGLSTTYFVGQERARILTERRNARLLREHNDRLKKALLF